MGREGAITGLEGHVVDAVRFVRLVQKAPEVLGEGGWGDDRDLIQAGLKTQGGHYCTIMIKNPHLEHKPKEYNL